MFGLYLEQLSPKHNVASMSGENRFRKANLFEGTERYVSERAAKYMKKLINGLTEKLDPEIQILADLFQILHYNLTE